MHKKQMALVWMVMAIALVGVFQAYWVRTLYLSEQDRMSRQVNILFRDLVYEMQLNRFKNDTLVYDSQKNNDLFALEAMNAFVKENMDSGQVKKTDTSLASLVKKLGNFEGVKTISIIKKIPGDTKSLRVVFDSVLPGGKIKTAMRISMGPAVKDAMPLMMGLDDSTEAKALFINRPVKPVVVMTESKKEDPAPRLKPVAKRSISPALRVSLSKSFVSLLTRSKSVSDTLSGRELDSAYKAKLKSAGLPLRFRIYSGKIDSLKAPDTLKGSGLRTSVAQVGLVQPHWYQLGFDSPAALIWKKILPQVLMGLFLILFISGAFVVLYRNLRTQERLGAYKNEFISNISHELKTPLATVQVAIEALRNFHALQDPVKTKEYLDISESELKRLSFLVDKVMKLSLLEQDRLVLHKENLSLTQLVQDVQLTMGPQLEKAGASWQFDTTSEATVWGDKTHLTGVLYNLIDNALKYGGKPAHIQLRLHPAGAAKEWVLEVEDNGPGISPEYRERIFDKFFRVPQADHHNTKGYGLGLSYVKEIVALHQGTIACKAGSKGGSLFVLTLPAPSSPPSSNPLT